MAQRSSGRKQGSSAILSSEWLAVYCLPGRWWPLENKYPVPTGAAGSDMVWMNTFFISFFLNSCAEGEPRVRAT